MLESDPLCPTLRQIRPQGGPPAGTSIRGEVWLGGLHLATYINGTVYFAHSDHLGSERLRTTVNGSYAGSCSGLAYGDSYTCTGTDPSPYRYGGYEFDSETGLDHMWFRYYNPRIGRFMSADVHSGQIDDAQSLNKFAYSANDPVNNVDPLGLDCDNGTMVNGVYVVHCNHTEPCPYGIGQCLPTSGQVTTVFIPARPEYCAGVGCDARTYGNCGGIGLVTISCLPGMSTTGTIINRTLRTLAAGPKLQLRQPNQSFSQCMESNASNYSVAGLFDSLVNVNGDTGIRVGTDFVTSAAGGNSITGLYFAFNGTTDQSAFNGLTTGAGFIGNIVNGGMGTTLTYGRRTSAIMSLNWAGKGGLPMALSPSTGGVKSLLGKAGTGAGKLILDAGLTLAETVGCF